MFELIAQVVVGGGSCLGIILLFIYSDDLGNMNIEKMDQPKEKTDVVSDQIHNPVSHEHSDWKNDRRIIWEHDRKPNLFGSSFPTDLRLNHHPQQI